MAKSKKNDPVVEDQNKEKDPSEIFDQAQGQVPVESKTQEDDKEYVSLFNNYVELYGFMPKDSWTKTDLEVLIENKQYETETLEIQTKQAEENRILEEKELKEAQEKARALEEETKLIESTYLVRNVSGDQTPYRINKFMYDKMDGVKPEIISEIPDVVKKLNQNK